MREVVEDVRRIAQSSEQNERWSATAPIEHFDPHIRRDGDERNLVPRRVRARVNRRHVVGGAKKHNDCDQTDKRTRRIERSQTAALHSNRLAEVLDRRAQLARSAGPRLPFRDLLTHETARSFDQPKPVASEPHPGRLPRRPP